MSRTVNGERLFDEVAKEILRRQLWQVAEYCGVHVLTYTVMSNHFHALVHVPQQQEVSDAELLRRYRVLYPSPTRFQAARLEVIASELNHDGERAVEWRRRQRALMGDVSQYMKLVKQRFSIWFNKSHQRFGTLWAERFKSVLVEPDERVLQTMAAYIDLNCVRAGLVTDPKEYRFCGYAAAVAGCESAQSGISRVTGGRTWRETQAHYRTFLFGTGAGPRSAAASITPAEAERVIVEGGKLPLASLLRCRIRFFTDGAVLGSRAFVQMQLARYHRQTGRHGHTPPHPLPPWADWGDMAALRGLRQRVIG